MKSQIECVFRLAGVLTLLKYYKLQVENLDHTIIVVKNWHNDLHQNYKQHTNLTNFMKVEILLVKLRKLKQLKNQIILRNWNLKMIKLGNQVRSQLFIVCKKKRFLEFQM